VGDAPAARPVGIRRSTRYLPEVECLRGVAILLVFALHFDGLVQPYPGRAGTVVSPALAFVAAGHTGVNLFFILSGFLLSLPFLSEARGGRPVGRREYFARRALRILPLYWTGVVVGTLFTMEHAGDLRHGLPYLFFLNAFPKTSVPLVPYSHVWWSLATEVQFYLLLPLLPFFLRTPAGRALAGVVLALWAAGYGVFLGGVPDHHRLFVSLSLFGRAPLFLYGIAAAAIYRAAGERVRERGRAIRWLRRGGADVVLLAVLVALGFLLRWLVGVGYLRAEATGLHLWHVAEGGLWTAALLLMLLAPLASKGLLLNRLFATLGVLSYSIYMWHIPVITFGLRWLRTPAHPLVGWSGETAVAAAVIVAVCVGLSAVTYRVIERPFLARKARIDR
jgi:peptidoglycan/LPS O-acetylase OafA/YrhL